MVTENTTRSLVLLSGGLDSTLSLIKACEETEVSFALTFDYGQKSHEREITAARKICAHFKIQHKVIALPFFGELVSHPFFGNETKCPMPSTHDLDDKDFGSKSAKAVWVPNRNGLFINVAASLAEKAGISFIYVGFNVEEATTFPDNSQAYINAVNDSLSYSTLNKVKVIAPTIAQNKTQIVADMIKHDFDLTLLWSCYNDNQKMCGQCESCMRLKRALGANKETELCKHIFKSPLSPTMANS